MARIGSRLACGLARRLALCVALVLGLPDAQEADILLGDAMSSALWALPISFSPNGIALFALHILCQVMCAAKWTLPISFSPDGIALAALHIPCEVMCAAIWALPISVPPLRHLEMQGASPHPAVGACESAPKPGARQNGLSLHGYGRE